MFSCLAAFAKGTRPKIKFVLILQVISDRETIQNNLKQFQNVVVNPSTSNEKTNRDSTVARWPCWAQLLL